MYILSMKSSQVDCFVGDIIAIGAASFAIFSEVGKKIEAHENKGKQLIIDASKNMQDVTELMKKNNLNDMSIHEEIKSNNSEIEKIKKEIAQRERKINLIKVNIEGGKRLLKDNESKVSLEEDTYASDGEEKKPPKNFRLDMDKFNFQNNIEELENKIMDMEEEKNELIGKICKLEDGNLKLQEKKKINNLNTIEDFMSVIFSNSTTLYLHEIKFNISCDTDMVKELEKNLNKSMGDKSIEINEQRIKSNVNIINNISNFLLRNQYNKNSYLLEINKFFTSTNEEEFKKIMDILYEEAEANTGVATLLTDKNMKFFLRNASTYIEKTKDIKDVEKIFTIFHKNQNLKIKKEIVNTFIVKELKTSNYKDMFKDINNMKVILTLYLVCLYTNANKLNLNKNKSLNEKDITESILLEHFANTVPQIVIETLMNFSHFTNHLNKFQNLEKIKKENDLILKIGKNILKDKENQEPFKMEDINDLILMFVNNIDSEKPMLDAKTMGDLSSILNSVAIIATNIGKSSN